MALSDYLTGDEWDACFYASLGQNQSDNIGESMRKTIADLLAAGHDFPGLDENGDKRVQVCSGVNAPKMMVFFGNPGGVDVLEILDNGREFLKRKLPTLVDETDEEWHGQIEKARSSCGNDS